MTVEQILDTRVDVVYDEEDDCWYLQEYANDGKGTTRESKAFHSADDAVRAHWSKQVDWQEWH